MSKILQNLHVESYSIKFSYEFLGPNVSSKDSTRVFYRFEILLSFSPRKII
jgi:hypothetical protein